MFNKENPLSLRWLGWPFLFGLSIFVIVPTLSLGTSPLPLVDDLTEIQAGGKGGAFYRGSDGFSIPMATATVVHRKDFVVGKSLFKENWVAAPSSVRNRQGLGPLFNAQSCSTCHFKDGRGQPPLLPDDPMVSMLVRLSVPGKSENGGPNPVPFYGDQFNHRANVGVRAEGEVHVKFIEAEGRYPDGTVYSLVSPRYEFVGLNFGPMPKDLMTSGRVAPQVVGLGLLEAIPEADILASTGADEGTRGKPNWVWDVQAKQKRLGRFGWKSNQPSVMQQNSGALVGDMGITSSLFPVKNCNPGADDCRSAPHGIGPDISDRDLETLETYVKLIAVPVRRDLKDPEVKEGSSFFLKAKCQSCHRPSFVTGVDPKFAELSNQRIYPYTDLLLHDMGEGLADHRPDFDASGSEWRTAPLWGIGIIPEVNDHTRLLHDGRARSIEEAILWHGGQAEVSKQAFMGLNAGERKKLIRFVGSL